MEQYLFPIITFLTGGGISTIISIRYARKSAKLDFAEKSMAFMEKVNDTMQEKYDEIKKAYDELKGKYEEVLKKLAELQARK